MTLEQKEILLKDLCARLPYGTKIRRYRYTTPTDSIQSVELLGLEWLKELYEEEVEFKPYLFPLSSMTNELWDKEFRGYGITEFTRDSFKYGCETLEFNNSNPSLSSVVTFTNQLIKNHFDIYGLIPMGLAIDATGKNIY